MQLSQIPERQQFTQARPSPLLTHLTLNPPHPLIHTLPPPTPQLIHPHRLRHLDATPHMHHIDVKQQRRKVLVFLEDDVPVGRVL